MKLIRLFALCFLLTVICSCKKENNGEEAGGISEFYATINEKVGGETATASSPRKLKWADGDVIVINGYRYEYSGTDNIDSKAIFKVAGAAAKPDKGKYHAYYPESLYDKDTDTPVLPFTQHNNSEESVSDFFPLYAESNTESLDFQEICGLLELDLTGKASTNVSEIILSAEDQNGATIPLSGPFKVQNGMAVVEESSDAGLILDCGEKGIALDSQSKPFYLAVPPGDYSRLNIKIKTVDIDSQCKGLEPKTDILTITEEAVSIVNGEVYTISFDTEASPLTISTEEATAIAYSTAGLSASLSNVYIWTPEISDVYFYCSETNGKAEDIKKSGRMVKAALNDDKSCITATATDMKPGTTFYYAPFAVVYGKEIGGEVKSFTTQDISAEITVDFKHEVYPTTIPMTGKLTVKSEGADVRSVAFYYSLISSKVECKSPVEIRAENNVVNATLNQDGTFEAKANKLTREKMYCFISCADIEGKEVLSQPSIAVTPSPTIIPGAVDLGLSVCWAKEEISNKGFYPIDISKPNDRPYIAWGETGVKPVTVAPYTTTPYTWDYYKWYSNGSGLTKYNDNDKLRTLEAADDAATAILGPEWRMPTKEEFEELIKCCEFKYLDRYISFSYQSNTINMYDGGYKDSDGPARDEVASFYCYWTSTLTETPNQAFCFCYDRSLELMGLIGLDRCCGCLIKPVVAPKPTEGLP